MTETRTLQFENARAVQSLYAHDLKLIKNLEESLGVKVTTREGWIKVEGEPAQVAKAEQVFTQLDNARQRGVEIQRHEFNYALNSVNEARADNLDDLVMTKVMTSARKPAIVARTLGQRNYLEAIQKHDVVFGIGPAGTGKTYLAVAMAVSALKKEQVDRIILTRPAVEAGEALGFLPAICNKRSRRICGPFTTRCTTCSSRKNWSVTLRARRLRLHRSPTCAAAP